MLPAKLKKIDISVSVLSPLVFPAKLTEEEQKLFRLYGKLPTHKNVLTKMQKDRKFFDSGDYALSKAGVAPQNAVGTAIPNPEKCVLKYFASLMPRASNSFTHAFLQRGVSYLCTYNVSGEDLYYKWESLSFSSVNRSSIIGVTPDTLGALRAQLKRELLKAQAEVSASRTRSNLDGRLSKGISLLGSRMKSRAPAVGLVGRWPEGSNASPATPLESIPRAGSSRVVFNGPDMDEDSRKRRAYRYMYEKISERSEGNDLNTAIHCDLLTSRPALDDRIDELAELVREHYGISEFGDPSASTDEDVVVVGRITLDSESSSAGAVKLNEASLCLESSRMMGSGVRVPLKFEHSVKVRRGPKGQGGAGLFPGAIVSLKGKNGGGGWFSASEILTLPQLQPSPSDAAQPGGPFSMMIASGPYTSDADLQYAPWSASLRHLKAQKPAVVLLIGPFIDASHPKIRSGDIDESPADMFRVHFMDNLRDFLDTSPDSLVLLLPSVGDIIHQHAAFPQPELDSNFSEDPRIKLLPNPCQFSLNGVTFAVSSVDVLFHLRKEELVRRAEEVEPISINPDDPGTDTMTNLCRYVLQQRSFYPIFPPPFDLSSEVNLDVSHIDGLKLCPKGSPARAPDVLVIPSRLKHFSKVVDHTVAINPSFVTKNIMAALSVDAANGHGPGQSRIKVNVGRLLEPSG
ncbi:hypothetical protein EVG20_g6039 [Dentipellis fragilis]|uniref:DNA polymerase alpha subunit B n=1 Tax=Dentipellis fragilis TaxID=205917 RepID=A0A4Y9YPT5_9AGAM|nr:hypothetical protein EVG20_g6039 [Dentipellis fragilis]